MALRQGISAGRTFNSSVDGMQRSDARSVPLQLDRIGRHLDPVAGVQGTATYPMRIGKPVTVLTPGAYIVSSLASGSVITFVGDYFDRITGVYLSPQGATTPPLACTVVDEQHFQVTFDVFNCFGQIDIFLYDNYPLWYAGNTVNAIEIIRAMRIQPLEQSHGATLVYRAPNFTVASGWLSSERANGGAGINFYPATASSGGPTQNGTIGGAPIFSTGTAPLTNADPMSNWMPSGSWYGQAVIDLVAITSTVAYRSLEAIVSDSLGMFAVGFYKNGTTWTFAVTARTGGAGYLAQAALPTNAAQRVIVQWRLTGAGVLGVRINGGAWVNGGTSMPSTTLDTPGSLVIGQNYTNTAGRFQGTIWYLGIHKGVPADSTFCDLMYALHNVNYPPTPIKLLEFDSRHLTVAGTVGSQTVTAWLDQSGNGWDATLSVGATAPIYAPAWASLFAPGGYNGLPAVQYTISQAEAHETSDTIAASIGANPITIFLVGHVDQSMEVGPVPAGNQYFVMTKGGRPVGIGALGASSWTPYAGFSAPSGSNSSPNRRSIVAAVMTQGDTTRLYATSKLPVTFASPDPITNYQYITDNLLLRASDASVPSAYASEQGETSRQLRGGGYLDVGITTGFRIGSWQVVDGQYSPSGVILRVIIFLGSLTQPQIEAQLAALSVDYALPIEDEVANEADVGLTGAWDAGINVIPTYYDPNFNQNTLWNGKATTAFTAGQNLVASGGVVNTSSINSLTTILTSDSGHDPIYYNQTDAFLGNARSLGSIFSEDGTKGSVIIAAVMNSANADTGTTLTNPSFMSDSAATFAIEYTTSGVRVYLGGIAVTGWLAAPTATNLIVLVQWDGTTLKIAVNAVSGAITWTTVACAGGLGYLSGTLKIGTNYTTLAAALDGTIGAVRTYRHALSDAQFNSEAVPIQTLLGWSTGFSTAGIAPLTASLGTYALTGTTTNLKAGHKIALANGVFARGGAATGLTTQHRLTCTNGAFALGSNATNLKAGHKIPLVNGPFVETGTATNLLHARRVITANGVFAEAGAATNLLHGYRITLVDGALALAGTTTNVLHNRRLILTDGAFAEAGYSARLLHGYALQAVVGAFVETGFAIQFANVKAITTAVGSFALVGSAANFPHFSALVTSSIAFAETGNAAGLAAQHKIALVQGAFVETRNAAALASTHMMTVTKGTFVLIGNAIAKQLKMAAIDGPFALTGFAMLPRVTMSVSKGTFLETGLATGLRTQRRVTTTMGAYALTGYAVTSANSRAIIVSVGVFTRAGGTAAFHKASHLASVVRAFAVAGTTTGFLRGEHMPAITGVFVETGSSSALERGHTFTVAPGAFAFAGGAISKQIMISPTPGVFTIAPTETGFEQTGNQTMEITTGAFVWNATEKLVNLERGVHFFTNVTPFTKTMNPAGLGVGMTAQTKPLVLGSNVTKLVKKSLVMAAAAAILLTRNPATLSIRAAQASTSAAVGTYALTGQSAGLAARHTIAAPRAGYLATTPDAGLHTSRKLAATKATFIEGVYNALLTMQNIVRAQAGAFVETGSSTNFRGVHAVHAGAGAYALTAPTTLIKAQRHLVLAPAAFVEQGKTAQLEHGRTWKLATGFFSIDFPPFGVRTAREIQPARGIFAFSGIDAALSKQTQTIFAVQAERGAFAATFWPADLHPQFLFTFTLDVDAETTIDLDDGVETTLTLEDGAETTIMLTHDDLYDVGDVVEIVATFNRRRTGGAVDPDVITVILQKPDGEQLVITDVTNEVPGRYAIRIPATSDMVTSNDPGSRGNYVQVTATGAGQSTQATSIYVRAPRIVV